MTNRILVNIRGCNGSGKSTVPLIMAETDEDMYVKTYDFQGKEKKLLTVFPTYKWVALGSYLNKTGGMDTLPNKEAIEYALERAIEDFPEYDILMEGILFSTTFGTYGDMFKDVEEQGIKVLIVTLNPPLEVCLQRIQKRNGGKLIKEELVESKVRSAANSHKKYKAIGLKTVKWDTSKCSRQEVFPKFLKLTTKFKRGEL